MTADVFRHLMVALVAGGTAFLFTFTLTPLVRLAAVRAGWVARPIQDRWGRRLIARLGGVAIFLGCVGATLLWVGLEPALIGFFLGSSLVFLLGLLDDVRRLPPYTKLVAQLLIGCVVVMSGIRINLIQWVWLAIPCSVLWFVLVMNAFNLLDNMDGLAAGVGAIAAGFCALHAAFAQQWDVVVLAVILGGACLGFLRFNFPPAKIYMGDSGSHFLGLSLAVLALLGSWRHSTQLLSILAVPTLVLAVPIFDTCFVTLQRLLHRQHPFVGGRDHVSHRLAILGLSTRQTVMALYGVSLALGSLSLVSSTIRPLTSLAIWLLVLTGLVVFGLYLGRVNVYRLEPQLMKPNLSGLAEPTTIIDTMMLHKRRLVEVLVDFILVSVAYVFANLLRYEGRIDPGIQQLIVQSLPIILVIKLGCFAGFGLYRGMWRYLGLTDLVAMFKAVSLGSALSACALLFLWRFYGFSRTVFIIDWMLTFLAVGGSRVAERLLDDWIRQASAQGVPVLIIGAGDTGARVFRSLAYEGLQAPRVVGFLDDDLRKVGDRIHGASVLGTRTELARLVEEHQIREVLIAITDPPADLLQYVQQCCVSRGVTWRIVTAGVTAAV